MNYHNKRFRPVENSANAQTAEDTVFHYQQEGSILHCEYRGGKIKRGQLLGIVKEDGEIEMRYHQINENDQLMTGMCTSKPEVLADGRLRLHESWRWTSGDLSFGTTILDQEIKDGC